MTHERHLTDREIKHLEFRKLPAGLGHITIYLHIISDRTLFGGLVRMDSGDVWRVEIGVKIVIRLE